MKPALIDLDGARGPYRTALTLFGFKTLGIIPFKAAVDREALLLLPMSEHLSSEEERPPRAFELAQKHIQIAMEHFNLQFMETQRKARLLANELRDGVSPERFGVSTTSRRQEKASPTSPSPTRILGRGSSPAP